VKTRYDIKISSVAVGPEEEELVLQVLRSGRLAQGPMVERLEAAFASVIGVRHVVAVSSGTTALVAAIQSLNLQPGDEIITTSFSFVATLNAILEAGATARLADIGEDYCLDPDSVKALIGPRTRAILPVHLYGMPADMVRLGEIAENGGLALIEDAAQAHGARINGQAVGTFGTGCFSLYATKNIMSGEGGLITTNDDAVDDYLRLARSQGMRSRYEYKIVGHNYRMTELQAAVAVAQVAKLAAVNDRRRENAAALTALLDDVPGLVTPAVPAGREHVFHQYTVRVTPEAATTRDELSQRLAARGVASGVYYPRLMNDYDCYRGHQQVIRDETPRAATIASEVLSLPVHPQLSATDLEHIATAVREALT
jgi:perosamine synthetase